jgi:hypothetical protein
VVETLKRSVFAVLISHWLWAIPSPLPPPPHLLFLQLSPTNGGSELLFNHNIGIFILYTV